MRRWNDLETAIGPWLDDKAGAQMPDYVDDMLAQTRLATQRPAWRSVERWMPRAAIRLSPVVRPAWLLLLLCLLALALVVAAAGIARLEPPADPWNLSVSDVRLSSSEIDHGDSLYVEVTIANTGTAANPSTHFRFRNTFENFGLKGCIPDTCSGADLSHPTITFDAVPAGKATTFRWVFHANDQFVTAPPRSVDWGFCIYAEPEFREPVACENTTTLVR